MTDLIIAAILAVIIAAAAGYIYKAKKSGAKCIGCSVGAGGCCSCRQDEPRACECGCHTEPPSETTVFSNLNQ